MSYRLYIDDQAFDPDTPARHPPDSTWMVAVSSAAAIEIINRLGPPSYISFDHDLGLLPDETEDTVMTVINYLTDNFYDSDIDYDIHSANVVGAPNIKSKMDSWKKSKTL